MTVLTIVALTFVLTPAAGAQTRAVEPAPPEAPSFDTLFAWLADRPGHSRFPDELDRLFSLATTTDELGRIESTILPIIADRSVLADAALRLGRIAITGRDFERASRLLETAFIASGSRDHGILFLQAQALLQSGRLADAELRARAIVDETDNYELKRRAYALVARALHLRGRSEDAVRPLETLSALDDPELVEPETLLLHGVVLQSLGRDAGVAIESLVRLHGGSVARRMLEGELIHHAPLPATLLAGVLNTDDHLELLASAPPEAPPGGEQTIDVEADGAEGAPAAARRSTSVTAIQVGSFSDPENAIHLADDLRDLGLTAVTESVERDGRSLSLVLVALPDGSTDAASRALGILRAAGYDGFLIY